MKKENSDTNIKINSYHMDNIGKIYLVLDFYGLENFQKKFTENKIRIFTKSEDGKLQIKIKILKENDEENQLGETNSNKNRNTNLKNLNNSKFNSLLINLFISSSINPKLNATKYILSPNKNDERENLYDRLTIIFCIKSNILNKNLIYEKYIQKMKIKDCFEIIENANTNENNNFFGWEENKFNFNKEDYYFKNIKDISCKYCSRKIIDYNDFKNEEINKNKIKILENFDYDYKEKLENLSCHESHTDDIVPDIEEKLKSM